MASIDGANRHSNRLRVVQLTSNAARLFPSEAYVTVLGEQRKAMADQLATAGKKRLGDRLDWLDAADLERMERAILVQLGFGP